MASTSIKPFKIDISDSEIDRLKQKLRLTDFPTEVSDVEPWSRGPPLSDIKRLVNHWVDTDGFDWRKAEARLNTFPQFTTEIPIDNFGTYNVHFIHQPSEVKNAIPLLYAHGWPGSFVECTKILPLLVQGSEDHPAFHVVAPSLIDFGFSDAAGKPGFNVDQHAEMCHKLMLQLGYTEYVTQGGDLGYAVTRRMAQTYPENLRAHHTNSAIPNEPSPAVNPSLYVRSQSHTLTEREQIGLRRTTYFRTRGTGYFMIQSTKPQTISIPITDSPAGLLAWVYDALYNWSDHSTYDWSDDEILTWVSIYYFSKPGPAASMRIYYEEANRGGTSRFEQVAMYTDVPLGIAHFPWEVTQLPRLWHQGMGPVVHESEWEKGGHFAAWERPEDLASDLRAMFGKGGGAAGVIQGKSGYDE